MTGIHSTGNFWFDAYLLFISCLFWGAILGFFAIRIDKKIKESKNKNQQKNSSGHDLNVLVVIETDNDKKTALTFRFKVQEMPNIEEIRTTIGNHFDSQDTNP